MEATIKCGKHLAEHANISGSQFHDVNLSAAEFHDVNLSGADFNNVNLSGVRFHNINFSDLKVTAAQIGGSAFKHIGPPPDKDGKQERQRPVIFEETMLCDSTFLQVDLSNAKIINCNIHGMTIDNIPVEEMIKAYKEKKG